jgi:hypothetical protein
VKQDILKVKPKENHSLKNAGDMQAIVVIFLVPFSDKNKANTAV